MIGNVLKLAGYALLAREAADFVSANQYYRERERSRRDAACSISGALVGMAAGVAVGMLFAPRSGKETRALLAEGAGRQMDRLQVGVAEGTRQFGDIVGSRVCSDDAEEREHQENKSDDQ